MTRILASHARAGYDPRMDRDAVRAWKRGHELAQERIREEARGKTSKQRVDELEALAHAATELGWQTTNDAEIDAVRARFALLRARRGVVR
jgi:hypothetical protein